MCISKITFINHGAFGKCRVFSQNLFDKTLLVCSINQNRAKIKMVNIIML